MKRTYNIGTECYGLITSHTDAEFLLPVKIVLVEKYVTNSKTKYKVKIRDIYESNFEYLKEHLYGLKVSMSLKSDAQTILIKRNKLDSINSIGELLTCLNEVSFYLEDNYITLDKEGLRDLYNRFTKYLINYHYRKLYQLMSRPFISNTPIFENQKDVFKRRVERIGFGDMFEKYDMKLHV